MSKRYSTPPITEAVCEFRILPENRWDLTIPGVLYDGLKDRFPHREQEAASRVEIRAGSEGIQPQVELSERVRFLTDDRNTFVRVGSRSVGVHRLRPYESWERFKPDIDRVFAEVSEATEADAFQRIGLRYINRIEVPIDSIELDDYFGFRPALAPSLPQDLRAFMIGAAFSFEAERDTCRVQLADAVAGEGMCAFVLDLDYWVNESGAVSRTDALDWVEVAHSHVEDMFEGAISDRLRLLFGLENGQSEGQDG